MGFLFLRGWPLSQQAAECPHGEGPQAPHISPTPGPKKRTGGAEARQCLPSTGAPGTGAYPAFQLQCSQIAPSHSLSPWQHFLCRPGWLEELPWAPSSGEGTFSSGKMPTTHTSPFLRQAQYRALDARPPGLPDTQGWSEGTGLPAHNRGQRLVPGPLLSLTRVLKPHHSWTPPRLRTATSLAHPWFQGLGHPYLGSGTVKGLYDPGVEMTKEHTSQDGHESRRRSCAPRAWDITNDYKCNLETE